MDSNTLFLHEEIIRNILKRLPVKSLIRFQCVCKQWKNLIKTRSFVADHLHHSSHQNLSLLLERSPLRLCLLDCGLQLHEVQNVPSINAFSRARIVGSCNGLLCVEINHDKKFPPSLLLWNPANRVFRYVPRRTYSDSDECEVGFGFSAAVNDYKIVRTYAQFDDEVNRVEVFSLSRQTWKGIEIGNLKGVKLYSESVTTNGAIFWFGLNLGEEEKGENDTEVIVSFDIAKEVFTLMPWPSLDYNANEKLTVYENKLAVLCDIWDDDDERSDLIDLWVMEEGTCASGERWSWTKIYTSSPSPYILNPMTV
ncbi:F-box/kelch-repeat protein At3g23880-like [Neltuma alba]|uniref:F-box/kelch-repeat protein At3g23880-like n=1 Tax=Neltuma alba TaxID=207710 RepID=UPI0010A2B697|nr:F-box/kelch-repeat protein At3g23880-like [Prosopis alba]XP_028799968.1 F-box/kelch-repeat protein At3g23880-like [Prosopis alba]XP_028799969.1 F-box/kelch-repeat protein At3g23880-like [Prosopis alba]